jgi:hypothetical protein
MGRISLKERLTLLSKLITTKGTEKSFKRFLILILKKDQGVFKYLGEYEGILYFSLITESKGYIEVSVYDFKFTTIGKATFFSNPREVQISTFETLERNKQVQLLYSCLLTGSLFDEVKKRTFDNDLPVLIPQQYSFLIDHFENRKCLVKIVGNKQEAKVS